MRAKLIPSVPDVYLSSTCFAERDLARLCAGLAEAGIEHLELSGNLSPLDDTALRETLNGFRGEIRYQVHNYFPPPADSFVLNLAHPATVEKSVRHCRRAIDLCSEFGARYYSVHAGWSFDPEPRHLGRELYHLEAMDLAESRAILKDACKDLARYGRERGVGLLLENNVVAAFNCPAGLNDRHHLADPEDAAALYPSPLRYS